MPLYEYRCTNCGRSVEDFHSAKARVRLKCRHCGGKLTRIYSEPGISFKGSGFYSTDNNRSAQSSPAPTPAKDGGSSDVPTKKRSDPDAKDTAEKQSKPKKSGSGAEAD